jgi:phosphotransferase system enzyme I (PtsP)
MLEILLRIIQEVNGAPDLENALDIIVRRVKTAIQCDVCSVYLSDYDLREHVLMATDGLRPEAVGKVRLHFGQGLISLISERKEPINLPDAPDHPRYVFASETGEHSYHGFLGVPIIQNRKILGVLVVRQQEPRSFGDSELTFLVTLAAQLAGAITHARASGELAQMQGKESFAPRFFAGRPAASGVAMGQVVVVYPPADLDAVPDRPAGDPDEEEDSFRTAVTRVVTDLMALADRVEESLPAEDLALFDAWLLMLESDALIGGTLRRIHDGNWAPGALRETIEEHAQMFDAMDDVYLRERASDVRDLGRRILMHLQHASTAPRDFPRQTILVGDEVSAVQLAEVPRARLVGVVSATGSNSSHVAILARGMGVPAVMGVANLPVSRMDGREVIVDGYRGRVYASPASSVRDEYRRLADEDRALGEELEALRGLPPRTLDDYTMPLYLNTGLVSETRPLGIEESQGIGLYRTELPFMVRDRFPGEMEQMADYRRVMAMFAPRPVTIRTLDIGGDKPLSYFPIRESNPFLGWRGIRISLDHPEIFLTQVRAMLRADIGLGNLRILLPMISSVDEVDTALELIRRAHAELLEEGYAARMPLVGVMIEVPAAVYQIGPLARRVDFLSVGSNDLTQYLLAVDRNNSAVAELYDELHPAVLHALMQVVKGAQSLGREVGICGEMAGNPMAAVLLLGMGVNSLSMSAGGLLPVKAVIRSVGRPEAQVLLQQALSCESIAEIRRLLGDALEEKSLGGLIRPGK